jgi:Transglycosylase SLT domain
MANLEGALLTGALLAGGGVAGYLGGRWLRRRWRDSGDLRTAVLGPLGLGPEGAPPSSPAAGGVTAGGSPGPKRFPAAPASVLPRRFDWIFEQHRGAIPIEYLRALAVSESGMQAGQQAGPAWGLMQIVEVVRRDYNRAHGTRHERADLLDPAVNVAIATWLLRTITASYARHHAKVPNLQTAWDNPRFVELLTFGWNAGWSEAGGVGRVARYLEARGTTDITIDLVHEHARAAGASRHLTRADKVAWCKGVVALYQRERGQTAAASAPRP